MAKKKKKVEVKNEIMCRDCRFFTFYEDVNSKGERFWGECAITGLGMLWRWSCGDAQKE